MPTALVATAKLSDRILGRGEKGKISVFIEIIYVICKQSSEPLAWHRLKPLDKQIVLFRQSRFTLLGAGDKSIDKILSHKRDLFNMRQAS